MLGLLGFAWDSTVYGVYADFGGSACEVGFCGITLMVRFFRSL